jgi:hypothetical protein
MEASMTPTLEMIQRDEVAMAVARALTLANEAARAHSIRPAEALVSITEEDTGPPRCWRIHYGPRDYVHRRGGDLVVVVDEQAGAVRQLLRGQ